MTSHHDVVVVGAGQAGLALSWHLTRAGVEHLLLERAEVGHEWRDGRWDAFTLVTPNWQCRLPGFPYRGPDPDGFMTGAQVHAYVRAYAESFGAPVREHAPVTDLTATDRGFALTVDAGPVTADQVVLATGGYHRPRLPPDADRLPPSVVQLHSSQYRNADALPDGAVLVVGSGQSGAQIAEDLLLEGRTVHLAVGGAPRVARRYRGRDCVAWLDEMGLYDRPIEAHPAGLSTREKTNHYVTGRNGGHDIDLRAFARSGLQLYGHLREISGARLTFAPDLEACLDAADRVAESIKDDIDRHIARRGISAPTEDRYVPVWRPERERTSLDTGAAGITAVVWAMGYAADHRWVRLPAFDGSGRPCHHRGISPVDGLYFLGLPWLHTWGSGRFASVGRDAEYLAAAIVGRAARSQRVAG